MDHADMNPVPETPVPRNPLAKTQCVACGKKIEDPDANYNLRGNFCRDCSGQAKGLKRY